MGIIVRLPDSSSAFASSRDAWAREALALAREYGARSSDPQAIRVAAFLEQHWALGVPLAHSRIGVVAHRGLRIRTDPGVYLVPVTSVDGLTLGRHDNGKLFASTRRTGQIWASYYRSHRAIYWAADWPLSPLWRAIILLHEGLHAFQHLAMPGSQRTRAGREDAATELEYRVLSQLGGRRFRNLLTTEAKRSPDENRLPANQDAGADALDAIFGKPISREDDMTRATFVEGCLHYRRAQLRAMPTTPSR